MHGTSTCKTLENNALMNQTNPGVQIFLRQNRNFTHPPASITADLQFDAMNGSLDEAAVYIDKVVQSALHSQSETLINQAIRKIKVALPPDTKLGASVSLILGDSVTMSDGNSDNQNLHTPGPDFSVFSTHCFDHSDPGFPKRAAALGTSIIIAGDQLGQGAMRNHPAHTLRFLGVRTVAARSFDPIHKDNLIDAGILPLEFVRKSDYDKLSLFDELQLEKIDEKLKPLTWIIHNITRQEFYEVTTSN